MLEERHRLIVEALTALDGSLDTLFDEVKGVQKTIKELREHVDALDGSFARMETEVQSMKRAIQQVIASRQHDHQGAFPVHRRPPAPPRSHELDWPPSVQATGGRNGRRWVNTGGNPDKPRPQPGIGQKGHGCCLLLGFPRGDSDDAGDDSGWDFDDD